MKNKFADFIDSVLLFICLGVLGLIATSYFTRNLTVILLCGLTVGLALTFIIGLFKKRKALPKQKQKALDEARNQFIFSSREHSLNFVKTALEKKYTVTALNELLIVKATAVSVNLSAAKLTLASLAESYAQAIGKTKRLIFLTAAGAEKEAFAAAASLPGIKIDIFEFSKVYDLLNWLGSLPKIDIVIKSKKANAKAVFKEALNANKTKKYLFASLLLLFSSLFMPFATYYIIIASLLITMAVLCRIDIVRLVSVKKSKKQKDLN